ncbi:hypothetical protein [Aeromonas caviae]|uniref:hypothetical protein n=1 Tax=Aeromonas caviae TaxID=648 RepID=UPI002B49E2E1|nr:hypothetical protein [Aeromonas caviae]
MMGNSVLVNMIDALPFCSIDQAAAALGCEANLIYQLCAQGVIKGAIMLSGEPIEVVDCWWQDVLELRVSSNGFEPVGPHSKIRGAAQGDFLDCYHADGLWTIEQAIFTELVAQKRTYLTGRLIPADDTPGIPDVVVTVDMPAGYLTTQDLYILKDGWLRLKEISLGVPPQKTEQPVVVPGYLDPNHPRYSKKLAAIINAWEACETVPAKTTAKRVLTKHLIENGGFSETQAEELAAVANWNTKGGAPATTVKEK